MPDPPPPPPSAADADDAAFTAALYSRIRGDAAAPAAPPTASDETTPLLAAAAPPSAAADATLHAHRWSAARNEHDLVAPPLTKPSVAPPAFVARVRERLQRELREGTAPSEGTAAATQATGGEGTATPGAAVSAEPSFQGFLAKLETDLASQYDRVLQGDLPRLEPTTGTDAGAAASEAPTAWCATLEATVPAHAGAAFEARHGVTLDAACAMAQRMVDDVVRGYKAYFEAERTIVAVAERYDALQEWAHKSKALFAQADSVKGTATAFDDMVHSYFRGGLAADATHGPESESDSNSDTGTWATHMQTAKRAWLDVQAQRHIVSRFQAVVGTPCTCKVCFGATVNTVLVPCGHTLCKTCAAQVGQCPFCNATHYSIQDVYFG